MGPSAEQYAALARLGPLGELEHYVAGLPFPGVTPADDRAAPRVMWNHAFGPWIADDAQGTRPLAAAVDIDGGLEASAFTPMALETARRN